MQQQLGLGPKEMDNMLNKKSGVLGITGKFTDRRDVIACSQAGDKRCSLALEIESYRIKKYIGSYYAVLGRVDAIVFTAGVGENAWLIREKALSNLEELGIKIDFEKTKNIEQIRRNGNIRTRFKSKSFCYTYK